jgi:hypothetical protein
MQEYQADEQAALVAAEKWLHLIDEGDAAKSWGTTASTFRSVVSLEKWQTSLEEVLATVGRPLARTLKSKQYTQEIPGAPDGEYVCIEYETTFEHKQHGAETITPVKDQDGEWRVTGYYIS